MAAEHRGHETVEADAADVGLGFTSKRAEGDAEGAVEPRKELAIALGLHHRTRTAEEQQEDGMESERQNNTFPVAAVVTIFHVKTSLYFHVKDSLYPCH